MSNSSQPDAKRKRLVLCMTALLLALALLGYLGVRHHNATVSSSQTPPDPTTWDGVPAALDAATQTQQYRDGGMYLSNPSQLGNSKSEQRDLYCYRLAIDFLRSLTPKQVDHFRRQENLPFAELSSAQQKALSQLSKARLWKHMTDGIDRSWISVLVMRGRGNTWYLFSWLRPCREGGFEIMVQFSFAGADNMRDLPFGFDF